MWLWRKSPHIVPQGRASAKHPPSTSCVSSSSPGGLHSHSSLYGFNLPYTIANPAKLPRPTGVSPSRPSSRSPCPGSHEPGGSAGAGLQVALGEVGGDAGGVVQAVVIIVL